MKEENNNRAYKMISNMKTSKLSQFYNAKYDDNSDEESESNSSGSSSCSGGDVDGNMMNNNDFDVGND